jgi:hypothetical protein
MMTIDLKRFALEFADSRPAGINWYNLEIALSRKGLGGDISALTLARSLVVEGLLLERASDNPALPNYQITEAGRNYLKG